MLSKRRWRVLLAYGLSLWIPIAGQLAFLCCLPCLVHDHASAAQGNGPERTPVSHADSSEGGGSHCGTCGLCAGLLCAGPPHVFAQPSAFQQATHHSWWPSFHIAVVVAPFTSRAPPSSVS